MNEVTFNATLVQEIEAIDAINELKANADASGSPYKRIRLHEIKDEPNLARLGHASKGNTDWKFLLELRDLGRRAATRWLKTSLGDVGTKTSADMQHAACIDHPDATCRPAGSLETMLGSLFFTSARDSDGTGGHAAV